MASKDIYAGERLRVEIFKETGRVYLNGIEGLEEMNSPDFENGERVWDFLGTVSSGIVKRNGRWYISTIGEGRPQNEFTELRISESTAEEIFRKAQEVKEMWREVGKGRQFTLKSEDIPKSFRKAV